ncbi:MAG: hypothetical protein J0M09_14065 [Xanthomonadales bacterium]|nr:hypothetical protein [Xanthomonadales bacterium]
MPLLRVAHGNDAPAEGQTRDEAKHAFDDAVLERLLALNAERFIACGPWKKRQPQLLDMLVATGRAREDAGDSARWAEWGALGAQQQRSSTPARASPAAAHHSSDHHM